MTHSAISQFTSAGDPMLDSTQPSPTSSTAPMRSMSLSFSGTGSAYFQIWIVDLLLTIVTLGVYSAWGKVHRLDYFTRNTHLDGIPFEFHGAPIPVLKGRLVAGGLLATYLLTVGHSAVVGYGFLAALIAVLPYLLRGALCFRLDNTRWRGQRFGFHGTVSGAYLTFGLPLLMLLFPFGFLALLAWPRMHENIKRYRHAGVAYGASSVQFTLPSGTFWRPYRVLYGVLAALLVCCSLAFLSALSQGLRGMAGGGSHSSGYGAGGELTVFIVCALILAGTLLCAAPLLQSRTGNLAWSHTHFPRASFTPTMTFGGLLEVHALNFCMTLFTAGLYYPFAAVRAHQYKLAHLRVTTRDVDSRPPQTEAQPAQELAPAHAPGHTAHAPWLVNIQPTHVATPHISTQSIAL